MPTYVVAMVNLYARENVDVEVPAESAGAAEKEALRLYPDNHVLSVTPRAAPIFASDVSERTRLDRPSQSGGPSA